MTALHLENQPKFPQVEVENGYYGILWGWIHPFPWTAGMNWGGGLREQKPQTDWTDLHQGWEPVLKTLRVIFFHCSDFCVKRLKIETFMSEEDSESQIELEKKWRDRETSCRFKPSEHWDFWPLHWPAWWGRIQECHLLTTPRGAFTQELTGHLEDLNNQTNSKKVCSKCKKIIKTKKTCNA